MTKKLKTNFVSAIILSSILLLQLVVLAVPAEAHEYVQLSLLLRKHPDSDMTKEDVAKIVEGMEEIIHQCRQDPSMPFLKITPIFEKMTKIPPGLEFDSKGELLDAKKKKGPDSDFSSALLWEQYQQSADQPPIYVLYVVHSILQDGRRSFAGINLIGLPIGAVADHAKAKTWVHEMGHGAGLEHIEHNWPENENLMYYPSLSERTVGGPQTQLNEDQCKKINEMIKNLAITKKSNEAQGIMYDGLLEPKSVIVAMDDPEEREQRTMPRNGHLSAFLAGYLFEPVSNGKDLTVTLYLDEGFPNENIDATYSLYLNTDNDKTTGVPIGDFLGIDKMISINVNGIYGLTSPSEFISAEILDAMTEKRLELPQVSVSKHFTADLESDEFFNSISTHISAEQLGTITPQIMFGFESYSGSILNIQEEKLVHTVNGIQPTIDAEKFTVNAGDFVTISGNDFSANSQLNVFWDGDISQSLDNVVTDSKGSFTATVQIPDDSQGDIILDVTDPKYLVGMGVFTVEKPELPPNGVPPPSQFIIISVEPSDQVGNYVLSFTKEFDSYVKVTVSASEPTQALINVNLIYQDDTIETVGLHKTIFPTGISEMIFSHNVLDKVGDARLSAEAYSDWQDKGGKEITTQVEEKVTIT